MIKKNQRRGISLIEIMLVVAIMSVLTSIMIPKVTNLIAKANEAKVLSTLGKIRSAISIYYGENFEFPRDLEATFINNQKYISNIPSLVIPKVLNNGNPGHPPHHGAGIVMPSSVWGPNVVDQPEFHLYYFDEGNRWGEVLIACTHQNTKGNDWDSR